MSQSLASELFGVPLFPPIVQFFCKYLLAEHPQPRRLPEDAHLLVMSQRSLVEDCIDLNFDPFLNMSACIWHNPNLHIGKSSFCWKEWLHKGIVVLGDLYIDQDLKSFNN